MINELILQNNARGIEGLGYIDGNAALENLRLLSKGALAGHLDLVSEIALGSPSPECALNNLEAVLKDCPEASFKTAFPEGQSFPQDLEKLIFICGSSQFLSGILAKNPSLLQWLFSTGLSLSKDVDAFRKELFSQIEKYSSQSDSAEVSKILRDFRHREYLRIGARDLLKACGVEETTRELSDLASACLDAALSYSIKSLKEAYGDPVYIDDAGKEQEAKFVVMGLGKLGGRELNFSSDIDIIYLYSSDKGETTGGKNGPISLHAFFVKASALLTKLISSNTEDGFVFRIDLDLRPEGRSGDMANSLRSAEIYYESWGQTWERSAMIKARPVAGSIELGEAFLNMIRPFVYRKYLDFTAIEEIKSMKEKIDLSLLRRNPDAIDVKLGVGGIREIEFFCQALQLIHGGKDPQVRERTTLKAIQKLLSKGFLRKDEADSLTRGYVFLRDLEHRIQIIDGRQTQSIPARPEELQRLSRMMGFCGKDAKECANLFWDEYKEITSSIHDIYRSLFYKSEEEVLSAAKLPEELVALLAPETSTEEAVQKLENLGLKNPKTALENLNVIKNGPPYLRMSARSRLLLQKLSPVMLKKSLEAPEPQGALAHMAQFISAIGSRTAFYSLLSENTAVIDELIKIFGSSEFLSRAIIEHPESLDLLLSKELGTPYKTRAAFAGIFEEVFNTHDYEERLDEIRRIRNQEVFRIGVNDIAGALAPRQVSVQMTFLAEAALEAAIRLGKDELFKTYGAPPGCASFAVIGMGKLGGKELIYGSDLDIVFVYADESNGDERTSGGLKNISAHEFFVKLGQRVISALTLKTRQGHVFNVDARLRPSGSSGPLVISREAFIEYHRKSTQVWERQALIRAREVAGDKAFGCSVLAELKEINFSKPVTPADAAELLRIRGRMETEISGEDGRRYNIKSGKGGLVDIEFLAQALQLARSREHKELDTPYTLKALKRLRKKECLSNAEYNALKGAYHLYRLLEMRLRIVHDRPEGHLSRNPGELASLAKRAGYDGADAPQRLLSDYEQAAQTVRSIYFKVMNSFKE